MRERYERKEGSERGGRKEESRKSEWERAKGGKCVLNYMREKENG